MKDRESLGELEIVERIRQRDSEHLIGDDVAFLPTLERPVVTVDQQISGVHFLPDLAPSVVAKRLLAVNLSDIAASGGTPRFAWLALSAPTDYPVDEFLSEIADAAELWNVKLAGGDLSTAPQLSASLTLLGEIPAGLQPLRRSSAAPGDVVWIGGSVGQSALGRELLLSTHRSQAIGSVALASKIESALDHLAIEGIDRDYGAAAIRSHLEPTPQLDLGRWLARQPRAGVIDISDGLVLDLHRLARESLVDATIDAKALESDSALQRLAAALGYSAKDLQLYGGEDYVLLFSLPPECEPPTPFGCINIGRTTKAEGRGGRISTNAGARREVLPIKGWDHFAPDRTSRSTQSRARGC